MTAIRMRFGDNVMIGFEAAVRRVGEGTARRAFAIAMNRKGRSTRTALKRTLQQQTSIKSRDVNAALSFVSANPNRLRIVISGQGSHFPLAYFGARQFGYGVRARVWGESTRFPSAFLVSSLGNAFVRAGSSRLPIRGMYGPAIPSEMLRDEALEVVDGAADGVLNEAARQIERLLE